MRIVDRLFHDPADPRAIAVTRIVIAAHALWILLSRPCLPMLVDWPQPRTAVIRYGWVLGSTTETALFVVLCLLLAGATLSRVASCGAAILLYHFAPLEDALAAASGPYCRGLTVDVLALAVLSFVPATRGAARSGDFRWPLLLIRFSVASQYLFSLVAKGPRWFTGTNIRDVARTLDLVGVAPFARPVIEHPVLSWIIAASWLIVSLGMMVAVVSRRVAMFIVPLALAAHVAAIPLFGIVWLAAPLLFIFFIDENRGSASPPGAVALL